MFRTITARRPGECQRCHEEFPAGTKVRWNGSKCWHLKSECPGTEPSLEPGSRTQMGFPSAAIEGELMDGTPESDARFLGVPVEHMRETLVYPPAERSVPYEQSFVGCEVAPLTNPQPTTAPASDRVAYARNLAGRNIEEDF